MTISNNILEAREKRAKLINSLAEQNKVIVSLKANIPGNNKSSYLAYLIINSFSFNQLELEIIKKHFFESEDGPFYLLEINSIDLHEIKAKLIAFENKWPLGRFIDLDLHTQTKQISRQRKRKCFFCDDLAINCIKNNRHSVKEVFDYIQSKTLDYYQGLLFNYIGESISLELNLDPKFGLVTKYSQGSHKDMDYKLMIEAKKAILPYFYDMFLAVVRTKKNLKDILIIVKKIGIEAEKAMYKTTNGINAYKGLIFHLGLIVTAYSFIISRNEDKTFLEVIKQLAKDFFKSKADLNTFGQYAYNKYNISGAIGEALEGYTHISKALEYLTNFSDSSLIQTLIYLISEIEDTTLLKRAKTYDYYLEVKNKFRDLEINKNSIENLTQYCIKHNLSFGGSADLLIVTIFIKKIMVICDKINL